MVEALSLVSYVVTFDDIGNQIEQEVERKTYCEIQNITMNEFYKAREQKIGVKYCVKINVFDYRAEKHVKFRGEKFKVIRTYTTGDMLELYLGD